MRKTNRLFFWIIVLALLFHGLFLIFLFSAKYMAAKKKSDIIHKPPVMIEHIKQPLPYDLPNMLPGKQLEKDISKESKKTDVPEEDNLNLKSQEISTAIPSKNLKSRRKSVPKPTFNFDAINQYATANGNSAFKNKGVDRQPTKEDTAILIYQERVKKHFTINVNRYADSTYFYNIDEAILYLILTIGKNGKILEIKTKNLSNNPAIPKLIEKIITYAGLFPAIPATIKLENFTLTTSITISKGKLSSGYSWQ